MCIKNNGQQQCNIKYNVSKYDIEQKKKQTTNYWIKIETSKLKKKNTEETRWKAEKPIITT